jgi:hypothetical protein
MSENNQQYKELFELKQKLQEKAESLKVQYQECQKQLESVTTTLGLLGFSEKSDFFTVPTNASEVSLKNLTQIQALEVLAKRNNGRISMKAAKRILLSAGLIKTAKNANNIIYNAIQRSEKFKRVSPGIYQLVSHEPQQAALLTAP